MDDIDIEAGDTGKQQRDARGRLIKGHKMLPGSGRLPGVRNWNARRVAESLGVSPLIVALTVIKTGFFPLAKGEDPKDQRRASPELFTKILLDTLKLVVPSLSAVQFTGELATVTASMDITKLMADPATAKLAQDLALQIAMQPRQIESGSTGPDDTDERPESWGHTFPYEDSVQPKRR
jgi:hypothetical protein